MHRLSRLVFGVDRGQVLLSRFAQLASLLLVLLLLLLRGSQRARYAPAVVGNSSSTAGWRLVASPKPQSRLYVHPCSKSPREILIREIPGTDYQLV